MAVITSDFALFQEAGGGGGGAVLLVAGKRLSSEEYIMSRGRVPVWVSQAVPQQQDQPSLDSPGLYLTETFHTSTTTSTATAAQYYVDLNISSLSLSLSLSQIDHKRLKQSIMMNIL